MTNEVSIRDEVANRVHEHILSLQDALTHLWAAVLAVEVVDASPGGELKRDEILCTLKKAYHQWQESQSNLESTFQEWTAVVGAQHQEVVATREWLRMVCPDQLDPADQTMLITDQAIAQRLLDTFDREACERTRRIAGLSELAAHETCNCLVECSAVTICPLFNNAE